MGLVVEKNASLIIYLVEEETLLSPLIESVTQPEIAKSIFLATNCLVG